MAVDACPPRDPHPEGDLNDSVDRTLALVREQIDALRALHPNKSDKELALACLRGSNSGAASPRVSLMLGLVGTVLNFAARIDE